MGQVDFSNQKNPETTANSTLQMGQKWGSFTVPSFKKADNSHFRIPPQIMGQKWVEKWAIFENIQNLQKQPQIMGQKWGQIATPQWVKNGFLMGF